jgi:hypothetical protein
VYVAWYKRVIASIVYSQLIVHGQRLSRYMNDVGSSPLSTTWWLVVRFATHDVHAQRTAATHNVRDMSLHMFGARCRVFIAQARTFLSKPKLRPWRQYTLIQTRMANTPAGMCTAARSLTSARKHHGTGPKSNKTKNTNQTHQT